VIKHSFARALLGAALIFCVNTSIAAADSAPMRITVEGEPLSASTDIQIQRDPLRTEAALNILATPNGVGLGDKVTFHTYSNYAYWIEKSEVRVFGVGQDSRETPLITLPVVIGDTVEHIVDERLPAQSFYVLRVYDGRGRFDETAPKPLTILDSAAVKADPREGLTGYGESTLRTRNIPLSGGSVTVSGKNVGVGSEVIALGYAVPVDAQGNFVIRQILPAGVHTAEVVVKDASGKRRAFMRPIEIPRDDWFHVALGDLTFARNHTTGPAQLVTQDVDRYEGNTELTGRGAFYVKGKFSETYSLTMSADTRERPVEDLFGNFESKDPRYLLERIDPERNYPTFGDDSTTEWDAPTQGRFYARLARRDSHLLWGNYQTQWTGLELNQFSRALYGADVLFKSDTTTAAGERRVTLDAFAGEPGTLDSREEFRGTGGSLYYLHRQDITRGSERVWVEARDATSGIVLRRTELVAGLDYEMSYLQGRILLTTPLSSVTDSSTLVKLGSLSGDPVYLVASYEYAPGLNETDSNVYGARNSNWLNDHMRLGVSGYRQGDALNRQTVGGVDTTFRYKPGTYLDVEAARSDGIGSQLTSIDGGFGFDSNSTSDTRADARRVQGVVDLNEIWDSARGRGSIYWQDRDAGFSGPGALAWSESVKQQGVAFNAPVSERTSLDIKADERSGETQAIEAAEVALHYQLSDRWSASAGGRHDDRRSDIANASRLLSQNGARTDVIARLDYKRKENWEAYTYLQGTADRDGSREENNRAGVGAERQLHERFKLGGEVSGGNGGLGGLLSGNYLVDERSSLYVTHSVETERPDSAYRGRFGNTVVGGRARLNDRISVYDEARATRGAGPESLTNAFGVDLALTERWSYDLKFEAGTVSDPLAGDLERRAVGSGIAYAHDRIKFASNLEYRDETGITGDRVTWLARNNLGYQVVPDWRLLGKMNFSFSEASQGNFFDGDFVDASLGAAFRPVDNDRLNTLFEYRYYEVLPSPGQVGLSDELLDFTQRSHVLSVDTLYDLTRWLSVGAKYGLRIGELRDSRVGGPWFSSQADLMVLRTDWHWIHQWDVLIEARRLTVHEADSTRTGALAAIYRHIGDHTKVGIGYNFTDFSDDLTDLSFRSRGTFLNVLSEF